MKNQAYQLKLLMDSKRKKRFLNYKKSLSPKQNIIAITSGKGGVGKSSFTTNLSIGLASMNKKVLVLDADLGLANIHILFNQKKNYDLGTVFKGACTLQEAVTPTPYQVDIICGGSGLPHLVDLSEEEIWLFLDQIQNFNNYDYILIDLSAGISKSVMTFLKAAKFIILVTTPEPTSLTDAYGLLKAFSLNENGHKHENVFLVLNKVISEQQVDSTIDRLNRTCQQYLNFSLNKLGFLPRDEYLEHSIYNKRPLLLSNPRCQYSNLIKLISKKVISELNNDQVNFTKKQVNNFEIFFKKLISQ